MSSPSATPAKMGDGIRMAWEAGAAEEGIGLLELFRVAPLASDFATWNDIEIAGAQPDLWVTPRGERFCDETVAFWDTHVGNANAKYARDGYTWNLMDDSTLREMIERGIDNNVGVDFMPGYRPVNVFKEFEAAFERGSTEVVAADSVEELAGKMGADAAVLKATVDEYNDCCAAGYDRLFAKEPRFLRPLTGPRYYAVKGRTVFLGTMGGIKVSARMEAVDDGRRRDSRSLRGRFRCGRHVRRQLPHQDLVRPGFGVRFQLRPARREEHAAIPRTIGRGSAKCCREAAPWFPRRP